VLKKHIKSKKLLEAVNVRTETSKKHAAIILKFLKETGDASDLVENETMSGIDRAAEQISESEDQDVKHAGIITLLKLHFTTILLHTEELRRLLNILPFSGEKFSELADEVKSRGAVHCYGWRKRQG
jgi:hypothetical protein